MYLYLYDSFLSQKKYANLLARIETRLTDLGIGGKISRLSPLRNIEELVKDEIINGVKNVIVVGNDKTLNEVVSIIAKHDGVTLGIVPVGPDNRIAGNLGIPHGEEACNTISARITKKIDLGKINNNYFISDIKITGDEVTLECEQQYKISPQTQKAEIAICNFKPAFAGNHEHNHYFDPQDGILEIYIKPIADKAFSFFKKTGGNQSIIPIKKIAIDGKQSVSVITEGQKVLKTPIKIEIAPKKITLIVGKNREF